MRNFSFSVTTGDTDNLAYVLELKKECKARGMTFSAVILKALKHCAKEVLSGKIR